MPDVSHASWFKICEVLLRSNFQEISKKSLDKPSLFSEKMMKIRVCENLLKELCEIYNLKIFTKQVKFRLNLGWLLKNPTIYITGSDLCRISSLSSVQMTVSQRKCDAWRLPRKQDTKLSGFVKVQFSRNFQKILGQIVVVFWINDENASLWKSL